MLWYWELCLKISGLQDENCARHPFEVHVSSAWWWLITFVQGIISYNKLMNLCEIWLFHIVWGVSNATGDNYHGSWWKQCFMAKVYRYIAISEVAGGGVRDPPYISCLLFKKMWKTYKSMTYTKIKFYIILIYNFFF